MARAGVREREADGEAEPSRGGVDADEALGVVDPGDRRERPGRVNAVQTPRAVRRQTRQPEREKSPGRQRIPSSYRHSSRTARVGSSALSRLDQPRRAGEGPREIPAGGRRRFRARRSGDLEAGRGGGG